MSNSAHFSQNTVGSAKATGAFRWPIGTQFISLDDEIDDDDDVERTTPAGNLWEVVMLIAEETERPQWMIGCPATGACLCPDEKTLLSSFKIVE
jgi:hypothetical protein